MNKNIIERAIRKARHSPCHFKIAALGLNKHGDVIYSTTNRPRFSRYGGGIHAEMQVMHKAGPSLANIILCRVGLSGHIRPIHPCAVCTKKARELGVKIYTVSGEHK